MLGEKLKNTRIKHDMTIQELAVSSRVSANMISRIERGLTTPSVDTMMKLATTFGLSLSYFVEEASTSATVVVTRGGAGREIFFFEDKHRIVSLTDGIRDPGFSVYVDTLQRGCRSGDGKMVQSGEEFVWVLEGVLEVCIDQESYVLNAGDSMAFKASHPHCWSNLHDGETRVLWVISPSPNFK